MPEQIPHLSAKQKAKISELKNNKFLKYNKYVLENGMQVILNPSEEKAGVAVAICIHVGSASDPHGKKGMAHLLEHLMFNKLYGHNKENYFKRFQKLGGECSGHTHQGDSFYSSYAPANSLEEILWLESERFKDISDSINQESISKEVEIIRNEINEGHTTKSSRHLTDIISEQLFSNRHPFCSPILGYLTDIKSISKEDIINFHKLYYIPSNASIVLSGDFQDAKARKLIQLYFGSIKNTHPVPKLTIPIKSLRHIKKVAYVNDYSCRANLSFHFGYSTPGGESKDCLALDLFMRYMFGHNSSPLNKIFDEKLPHFKKHYKFLKFNKIGILQIIFSCNNNFEEPIVLFKKALEEFEQEGIDNKFMTLIYDNFITGACKVETNIKDRIKSIVNYNAIYACVHPVEVLEKYLSITSDDIYEAFKKYIFNRPHLELSVVSDENKKLILKDSFIIKIRKEKQCKDQTILAKGDKENTVEIVSNKEFHEPIFESKPLENAKYPDIWTKELTNGMKIFGISNLQSKNIIGEIVIKVGYRCEPVGKSGLAYLYTEFLNLGTSRKRRSTFTKYLKKLESELQFTNKPECISAKFSCPPKNLAKLLSLIEELILHPCFVNRKLNEIKKKHFLSINNLTLYPESLGLLEGVRIMFGEKSTYTRMRYGYPEDFKVVSISDARWFYDTYIQPSLCSFNFVGPTYLATCEIALNSLEEKWMPKPVELPTPIFKDSYKKNKIYIVDYPSFPRAIMYMSFKGIPVNHPDYSLLYFLCYELGNSLSSLLYQNIRQKAGLAYSISSDLLCGLHYNFYYSYINIAVQNSKKTFDIMRKTFATIGEKIDENCLEDMKMSFLSKRIININDPKKQLKGLFEISLYDLPLNTEQINNQIINSLTLSRAREIISKYFIIENFYYSIIGDLTKIREQFGEGEWEELAPIE